MNSLSSTSSEDAILAGLLDYCVDHGIQISPNISVRRVPGKGLGVYTSKPLRRGERVMHVPTAALFTTASVPPSFVGKEARKTIPVHALLAAYLAFGMSEAKREEHARWMATWPRLTDFTSTMPLFWPARLKAPLAQHNGSRNTASAEQGEKVAPFPFLPLPPSLTGSWLPSSGEESRQTTSKVLDVQESKLESHLQIIAQAFPSRASALLSPGDPLHWKFIHMWCVVSSRCFYYLRPGQQPPKDSNEAMALCPAMDLFNHSDAARCHTTYDRKGYYVTTDQEYSVGKEVLLGYGAHSNDVLWNEYGFIMDSNASDGVQLDEVVLASLTDVQKKALQDAGYLGDYWLKPDGLCWRSEAVAWLDILTPSQWHRFLEGKYDPAVADRQFAAQGDETKVNGANNNRKRKRKSNETSGAAKATSAPKQAPSERAKRRQLAWLASIAGVAEHSLRGLTSTAMRPVEHNGKGDDSDEELLEWFGDADTVLESQGLRGSEVPETKSSQARLRHRMCAQRWRQILKLCTKAMGTI
ncbi:hypothetical protein A1O3_03106 [Capronia epimyces CBS 606.96]|uniref:SET domain-containing protein n=1 Tax=Capronia epimyces CBS 606.96 TaxID=1182542 RepID=W9YBZ2_9EURO|nr:uncharacterized protein A1O3_03106 [Capronia epimyces CBS 606.96]EXJ90038.1 hypothetical protein A1O3_03106 [Capronia epimyces CBS 606.96]